MIVALAQQIFGQENGVATLQTNTLASPTKVGNTLVAVVSSFKTGGADTAIVITDSNTNSWSAATALQTTTGNARLRIFYAPITTAGSSHTVTATANATAFISLSVFEFQGILYPGTPLDQNTGGVGSSTAGNSGNVTTAGQADVFISGATVDNASITFTPGNNFTKVDQQTGGQNLYTEYKIDAPQTTAGTYTWSGTTPWAAVIATFKGASSNTPGNLGRNFDVADGMSRSEVAN